MRLITAAAVFVLAAGLALAQTNESPQNNSSSTTSSSSADSTGSATTTQPAAKAPAADSAGKTASSTSTAGSPQASAGANTPTASEAASAVGLFAKADLAGKLEIINKASARPSTSSGPLYQAAVDYLVANLTVLRTDKIAQTMAVKASQLIGHTDYRPAAESVWKLFQFSTTKTVRLTALDTLAIVGKGSTAVVNQMNQWLVGRNLLHLSDSSVDPQLIDGCVRALAAVADPSSFSVLFSTMEAGYGEPVTNDARNGLKLVGGNFGSQLLNVVQTARYPTRLAALKMAMSSSSLTVSEKGQIATAGLSAAFNRESSSSASPETISSLRFTAVKALGQLEWTPAQSLVLENFNRAATDFGSGNATANQLIASANTLADMSTHEAAVRLSLYLGLINSQIGKGSTFDQSVTRAVVEDLGRIGDKVAFDNLYAMQFLNYPEEIKRAADSALQNLTAR